MSGEDGPLGVRPVRPLGMCSLPAAHAAREDLLFLSHACIQSARRARHNTLPYRRDAAQLGRAASAALGYEAVRARAIGPRHVQRRRRLRLA